MNMSCRRLSSGGDFIPSTAGQPWKRRMTVNSWASQLRQEKAVWKGGSGTMVSFCYFFQDFTHSGKFPWCSPSSTWTQNMVSRNGVYFITHLNATGLFLHKEGTMFSVITIWTPARLLSNTSWKYPSPAFSVNLAGWREKSMLIYSDWLSIHGYF